MKKIISIGLCVILLFQIASCYPYYSPYPLATTQRNTFAYEVETGAILESGEPLKPYTVYNGITDAVSDSNSFRPFYRQGICRTLKGKPVVVLLFMDDDESSWSEEEVVSFTNESVVPALGFLKREAARWNVELDFEVESYSTALTDYTLDYFGVLPTSAAEDEYRDTFEQAAGDLGFATEWVFYSYMQSQYPTQDIIFVTLFNKQGRSYAMQYARNGFNRNVEYCVVFSKTTMPKRTLAHEILHLFGAEDLYAERSSEMTAQIAESKYPCDVMLCDKPFEESCVDAYTAYAVGWTNEIPDVCYMDGWDIDD